MATMLALSLLPACERERAEPPVAEPQLQAPCHVEPGCRVASGTRTASILIGPHPQALRPFGVQVRLSGAEPDTEILVRFAMPGMEMGVNRYRLLKQGEDLWRADVTLPVCMSGRSDWIAEFELTGNGRGSRFAVPFPLEK